MSDPRASPGHAAGQAYETGLRAAAVAGLAVVGSLYWFDQITPFAAVFTLVVLFPTYLLVAAAVLSKWLGLDKDVTDLRPVVRERETWRTRQEYPESRNDYSIPVIGNDRQS